ncbi:hypothetical protein ACFYP4_10260 [Streptomyces sp. NPDC005551]|uniref:hypothetical protein n=1 Tax=Streptomyces sp. NPDC005551 TaxID=3364725 RepID=UPI00368B08D5
MAGGSGFFFARAHGCYRRRDPATAPGMRAEDERDATDREGLPGCLGEPARRTAANAG